jgi:hypothetical protein
MLQGMFATGHGRKIHASKRKTHKRIYRADRTVRVRPNSSAFPRSSRSVVQTLSDHSSNLSSQLCGVLCHMRTCMNIPASATVLTMATESPQNNSALTPPNRDRQLLPKQNFGGDVLRWLHKYRRIDDFRKIRNGRRLSFEGPQDRADVITILRQNMKLRIREDRLA